MAISLNLTVIKFSLNLCRSFGINCSFDRNSQNSIWVHSPMLLLVENNLIIRIIFSPVPKKSYLNWGTNSYPIDQSKIWTSCGCNDHIFDFFSIRKLYLNVQHIFSFTLLISSANIFQLIVINPSHMKWLTLWNFFSRELTLSQR